MMEKKDVESQKIFDQKKEENYRKKEKKEKKKENVLEIPLI